MMTGSTYGELDERLANSATHTELCVKLEPTESLNDDNDQRWELEEKKTCFWYRVQGPRC